MIAPCLEAIYKHIHWTPNLSTFKTKNTATFKITFSTFQISISVPKISVARERERKAEKGYDGNNTFNDKITYMADACIVAKALVRGKLQRHTHVKLEYAAVLKCLIQSPAPLSLSPPLCHVYSLFSLSPLTGRLVSLLFLLSVVWRTHTRPWPGGT